jgi:hypothetical protein
MFAGLALIVDTNTKERQSVPKFQIVHKIEGTRITEITLPNGAELPEDWDTYGLTDQDEWLYAHQISSVLRLEDIDFAEAHRVEQVSN